MTRELLLLVNCILNKPLQIQQMSTPCKTLKYLFLYFVGRENGEVKVKSKLAHRINENFMFDTVKIFYLRCFSKVEKKNHSKNFLCRELLVIYKTISILLDIMLIIFIKLIHIKQGTTKTRTDKFLHLLKYN